MADLSCRSAELLAADVEMGRASQAERMRVEVHMQRCEPCAARTERVRALAAVLRAEPVEPTVGDRAIVASALMEAHDQPAPGSGRARLLPLLAAAAVLIAAGVSAAWLLTQGGSEPAPVVERGGSTEAPRQPLGPDAPPRDEPVTVALSGLASPCPGVTTETGGDARAFVVTAQGELCRLGLDEGELRLSVDPAAGIDLVVETPTANVRVVGTVFSVGVEDGFTSVVVYRGTVEVSREEETLRVTGGHQVGVERDRDAVVRAVEPSALEPLERLAGGSSAAVGAGQEGISIASRERTGTGSRAPGEGEAVEGTEPTEPEEPSQPSAREALEESAPLADLRALLGQGSYAEAREQAQERAERPEYARRRGELFTVIAESYKRERQWQRARHWYEEVIRVSPGTVTAANALVGAADLALQHLGQHADALRLYEAYLEQFPRGALHEEALIGRCRALRAAGRLREARACARAYLATHPDGRQRAPALRLLE